MKRSFLLLSALLSLTWAQADNVLKVNGEEVAKDFTTITVDYNKPGNLLVHFTDETVVSYNMNLMEILPNETSGISEATASAGRFFSIKGRVKDVLQLSGLEAGTPIAIYAANGRQVYQGKATASDYAANTDKLAPGVYILRVGKQAVKFIKE